MADVELSEKAIDQLDDLQNEKSDRIVDKLEDIKEWPNHYLERLQGYPYYKLRVGDYRVIVDWKKEEEVIFVHKVGHRRNVYK